MMINKNEFQINNDKKILHKVGKHWVTVSIAMLALLGGGAVATMSTTAIHADATQPKTEAVKDGLNEALAQPVKPAPASAGQRGGATEPSNVQSQANDMHHALLMNAPTTPQSPSATSQSSQGTRSAGSASGSSAQSSNSVPQSSSVSSSVSQSNPSNSANSQSVSSSASSSSVSSSQSNAEPVNTKKPFNSAYDSYMAKMSGIDSEVAKDNDSNIKNNNDNNQNKSVIKKNLTSQQVTDTIHFYNLAGLNGRWAYPGAMSFGKDRHRSGDVNSNYTIAAPRGFALVNPDGTIANGTNNVANDTKVLKHTSHNQTITLDIAPVDDGLVCIDPTGNGTGVKFTGGIANSNLTKDFSRHLEYAKNITFGNSIDTSHVTNMSGMFSECRDLQSLDLGNNFDTSHVTDMSNMFNMSDPISYAHRHDNYTFVPLQSLNLGDKFDTSNVTNMSDMFCDDEGLQSLNLGDKFNTSKVTNMNDMFSHDDSLQSLNLGSKFDTSQVTTMSNMFSSDRSLQSLDLGNKFDTSKVTNMRDMFLGNLSLQSLDLGDKFDTSKAYTYGIFGEIASGVLSIDDGQDDVPVIIIKTPKTKIKGYSGLVDLNTWSFNRLNNSEKQQYIKSIQAHADANGGPRAQLPYKQTFYYKELTDNSTGKVIKDKNGKPYTSSTPNDFSDGNVGTFTIYKNPIPQAISTVKFHDIYSDIDGLTAPSNVTETEQAGSNQYTVSAPSGWAIVNPDGTIANGTNNANNDSKTFQYRQGNQTLNVAPVYDGFTYKYDRNNKNIEFTGGTAQSDLSNFATHLWLPASDINSIKFDDNIDTTHVTNMSSMFAGTTNLQSLNLGQNFDTSNVKNMSLMFSPYTIPLRLKGHHGPNNMSAGNQPVRCKLQSLDLGDKFDTSNVTNMAGMFEGNDALKSLDLGDKFDTSNVTNMTSMFFYDTLLESLNLGNKFDTSKVTSMRYMFLGDFNLQSLDLGNKFDTSNVTDMHDMFGRAGYIGHNIVPFTDDNIPIITIENPNTKFSKFSHIVFLRATHQTRADFQRHEERRRTELNHRYDKDYIDAKIIFMQPYYKELVNSTTGKVLKDSSDQPYTEATPSNFENSNIGTFTLYYNPEPPKDTINYTYNGKTLGTGTIVGNTAQSTKALDTITANNLPAKLPVGYQLVNPVNKVPYDGKTHDIAIKPVNIMNIVEYTDNNGSDVGNMNIYGQEGTDAPTKAIENEVPKGYELSPSQHLPVQFTTSTDNPVIPIAVQSNGHRSDAVYGTATLHLLYQKGSHTQGRTLRKHISGNVSDSDIVIDPQDYDEPGYSVAPADTAWHIKFGYNDIMNVTHDLSRYNIENTFIYKAQPVRVVISYTDEQTGQSLPNTTTQTFDDIAYDGDTADVQGNGDDSVLNIDGNDYKLNVPTGYHLAHTNNYIKVSANGDYTKPVTTVGGTRMLRMPLMKLTLGIMSPNHKHDAQPANKGNVTPVKPVKPASGSTVTPKPASSTNAAPSSTSTAPVTPSTAPSVVPVVVPSTVPANQASAGSNMPSSASVPSTSTSATAKASSASTSARPATKPSAINTKSHESIAERPSRAVAEHGRKHESVVRHHHITAQHTKAPVAVHTKSHVEHARYGTKGATVAQHSAMASAASQRPKATATINRGTAQADSMPESSAPEAMASEQGTLDSHVTAPSVQSSTKGTVHTESGKLPQTGETKDKASFFSIVAVVFGAIMAGLGRAFDRKRDEQ